MLMRETLNSKIGNLKVTPDLSSVLFTIGHDAPSTLSSVSKWLLSLTVFVLHLSHGPCLARSVTSFSPALTSQSSYSDFSKVQR